MATIVLAAAGMALGGSVGGSFLGLSMSVMGRAAGAAIGRSIDQRLLGGGGDAVETGRVDRFRLTGASEGASVMQVHGRMRVAGQVIWATQFLESVSTIGGGKGSPSPTVTTYSYSVSLAIAMCEGVITRVGRVWADGIEIARDDLNMRVYEGGEGQGPDPKMEAVEGVGAVPAYRGMAYVVLEDLALGQFGNRVPQFSFEVFRPAAEKSPDEAEDLARLIRGVALIPGTGEYALATTPVYMAEGYGADVPANINSAAGKTDFLTSLDALTEELPNVGSVSLVVSWFGNDLRCGSCAVRPKVEQSAVEGPVMPWQVSGLNRSTAQVVPYLDDSPVYGGTPADASVIEAIRELKRRRKKVVFYPFILMDQLAGNTLPDPWTGGTGQPPLPWRGRITLSVAPGRAGTPDRTGAADAQVAAFFGNCLPSQFVPGLTSVGYSGPAEWGFRRFILHYAHLCALAGGVDSFCIGSELRSLTQIRGAGGFPVVARLRTLAAEVKAILGPSCKIGYAADWSEYHGYQPEGTGDKLFHLDPLWADPAIDFIGIDNYMPLSDWRDGVDHADATAGAIYNLDYLTGNVAGGEGYDWYYHSVEAQEAQIRTPISDFWGEPWVWRYKDIKGWWQNEHHDRVNGERIAVATPWVPESKPVWFTEIGCAAIDKGANEPNKFLDPKSSESFLPKYSNGLRDDFMQMQYLRAVHRHWADPVANPQSREYSGRMVDTARTHVWAWDARPFPHFPSNTALWSDGGNYTRGHWLNGRSNSRTVAGVVSEICGKAGVTEIETGRLWGVVRGYHLDGTMTARAALQPLMTAFGFDAMERDGVLAFVTRTGQPSGDFAAESLVLDPEADATLVTTRAPEAAVSGRVRVNFVDADADYDLAASEAVFSDEVGQSATQTELPLALTRAEGEQIAERWLAEARVARDTAQFALPPSASGFGPGDVIAVGTETARTLYRIDRMESREFAAVEGVRVEPEVYLPHEVADQTGTPSPFVAPSPVEAVFLDLPLMTGDEVPHAPHLVMSARAWPGSAALYSSSGDSGYGLEQIVSIPGTIGESLSALFMASSGLWDRGPALRVRLIRGALSSVSVERLLAGANLAAIGDGLTDLWELFQFADAELVAPRTYDLRLRLRGQAGTDGVMPQDWPAGSRFVLMDSVPVQIALSSAARDIERSYRWGPAGRPIGDPSYRMGKIAFRGIGLRPYSVSHLSAVVKADGAFETTWIRRTRIDGDIWGTQDAPLGEAVESYVVRVIKDGMIRRETVVSVPTWTYAVAAQVADGVAGAFTVAVAQISDRFGPGPFADVQIGGA
jgi:hypothetical protein